MPKTDNILFLYPYYVNLIWGGNNLREKFGFETPTRTVGEAWSISAYTGESSIVKSGKHAGKSLKNLWFENRELFGNLNAEIFPLLVKFIDANDDLSVQVHPDDDYAKKIEGQPYGKKECWYVIDCKKDATIIVGQKAKDKQEFVRLMNDNKWDQILNEIPIKPGDFFQIDPGTVHAIKSGTIILETQQTSDLTYRLYDYNRLLDGKPRELHINKALDSIDFSKNKISPINYDNTKKQITTLSKCDEYTVNLINVENKLELNQDFPFLNITVIKGQGSIDGCSINSGDSFILPANYGSFELNGNMKIISSHV